jgi:hypothetical protein
MNVIADKSMQGFGYSKNINYIIEIKNRCELFSEAVNCTASSSIICEESVYLG